MGKTLFDKVWDNHIVDNIPNGPSILYVDQHLIHEVTSPQAFSGLKKRNIESILKAQSKATMNIFKLKSIPFRQFVFNKKEEVELGKVFTFFVLETILLARLMNINPFDQPAVEQVKIETKRFLR